MAVSQSQIVDLLYKQAFGVTKTDTANVKSPSNESIASPLLIRGDTIWVQSDSIPGIAASVSGIVQGYTGTGAVECAADTTTVPVSGVYPTWLTNLTDWIPQEFGATYVVKVYVDNPGASNPTLTGTQIFADGSGGTGQYYYNYISGVLNFIGETIPAALTSGKVLYVVGYRYIGIKGISGDGSTGNITFSGDTISTNAANANITISANGTGQLNVTSSISASGNVTGNYFLGNGSQLTGVVATGIGTLTTLSVTGNVESGNLLANGLISATSTITSTANIAGGNLLTGGLVSSTGNISGGNIQTIGIVSATGNISGNYFIGNGTSITGVLADRGSDQNNWNTLTQMGVYTVNRLSWSGTQGTPLDSQVYVGLLEVKNSTNTSIEQIFYPGTVDTSDAKIQWNRTNWSGSWSDWYKIVNDYQTIPGGEF